MINRNVTACHLIINFNYWFLEKKETQALRKSYLYSICITLLSILTLTESNQHHHFLERHYINDLRNQLSVS